MTEAHPVISPEVAATLREAEVVAACQCRQSETALTRRFDEMERRLTNLIQARGIQLAGAFGQQLGDTRRELRTWPG